MRIKVFKIIKLFLIFQIVFSNKLSAKEEINLFEDVEEFNLKGTDEKIYTNADLESDVGTVLIFLSNHCKVSQRFQMYLNQLNREWIKYGIKLFVFSPNFEKAILPDELAYADLGDSFQEMREKAELEKYEFPYIYDGENQILTNALGVKITPTAYLFNSKGEIIYRGRLGNHEKPDEFTKYELNKRVKLLINGNQNFFQTRTFGTSIKFKKNLKLAEDVKKRYALESVYLFYGNEKKFSFFINQNTNYPKFFYVWTIEDNKKIMRENLTSISTNYKIFRKRGIKVFTICICNENEKETALEILKRAELSALNFYTTGQEISEISKLRSSSGITTTPFCRLISGNGIKHYGANGEIHTKELRKAFLDILDKK